MKDRPEPFGRRAGQENKTRQYLFRGGFLELQSVRNPDNWGPG